MTHTCRCFTLYTSYHSLFALCTTQIRSGLMYKLLGGTVSSVYSPAKATRVRVMKMSEDGSSPAHKGAVNCNHAY